MFKELKKLAEKYRGLKIKDLDQLNPSYSCVICANTACDHHNKPRWCCDKHKYVDENTWARFYNFED